MAFCPFIKSECVTDCILYTGSAYICALLEMNSLLESIKFKLER